LGFPVSSPAPTVGLAGRKFKPGHCPKIVLDGLAEEWQ
jgi:hypothetical protein